MPFNSVRLRCGVQVWRIVGAGKQFEATVYDLTNELGSPGQQLPRKLLCLQWPPMVRASLNPILAELAPLYPANYDALRYLR